MIHSTRKKHKLLIRFALSVGVLFVVFVILQAGFHVLPCIMTRSLVVGQVQLRVCVADEPLELTRGLSRSRYLPPAGGMLFVFPESGYHAFWMREMRYPIDIIWLNDDMQPVEVARNVHPNSYPSTLVPSIAVRYVLETRPGVVPGQYPAPKIVENPLAQ